MSDKKLVKDFYNIKNKMVICTFGIDLLYKHDIRFFLYFQIGNTSGS